LIGKITAIFNHKKKGLRIKEFPRREKREPSNPAKEVIETGKERHCALCPLVIFHAIPNIERITY
jgi:hypothetical protein